MGSSLFSRCSPLCSLVLSLPSSPRPLFSPSSPRRTYFLGRYPTCLTSCPWNSLLLSSSCASSLLPSTASADSSPCSASPPCPLASSSFLPPFVSSYSESNRSLCPAFDKRFFSRFRASLPSLSLPPDPLPSPSDPLSPSSSLSSPSPSFPPPPPLPLRRLPNLQKSPNIFPEIG